MPFSAFPIQSHSPVLGRKYVFDANVWIYVLEADLDLKDSARKAEQYVNLLQRVKQAGSPKPKVVLPAIILSEVINRLLRSYYFPLFIEEHKTLLTTGSDSYNYKHVYRSHEQFRIDYEMILYSIKAYHNLLELVSDEFSLLRIKDVFNNPNVRLDFNDYILVEMSRRNDYIIVSDDGDLEGQDITVVTGNQKLLQAGGTDTK